MRRMGWKVSEPLDPARHDFITAAGEIVSVPKGIAPGFGYNPGTAHLRVVADRATASLGAAIDAGLGNVARQTLRELVADPAFDQFLALPDPQFPVMILDDRMAGAISDTARVAVLPQSTLAQARDRAMLTPAILRQLPRLGDDPQIIARVGDSIIVFTRTDDGEWLGAIVARTANGEGVFIEYIEMGEASDLWQLVDPSIAGEFILDRR